MGVDGLGVDRRASKCLATLLTCPAHSAGAGCALAVALARRLGAHRARAGLRPCPAPRWRLAPTPRPAPVLRPSGAFAAPVQNFDISHSTFGPPWCQRGGCSAYIVGGDGRASVSPGERRPGNDGGCLGRREARDQRLGHAPRSPKLAPTRPTLRDARILSPRLEPTGQKWAVRPSRRTAERHGARSRPGDRRGLPWVWMGWA